MALRFLSLGEVLEIHADQIRRYGGESGARDLNLLKSALGMPRASFAGQFLHGDVFEMGAAYLYHITCNHPFLDGNKRTGALTAFVFLHLNGLALEASDAAVVKMVLGVARGERSKAEVAVFLRKHARPL